MAKNETDREDLMREAIALTERVELRVPGFDEFVTVGFRKNSAMSVFVSQDPVYQFDPEGRLRRAFVDGFLYRSQHVTVARLQRVRTAEATQLLRYDLAVDELQVFHDAMRKTLAELLHQFQKNSVSVVRAVPQDSDLLPKIVAGLEAVLNQETWLSPPIVRR